MVGAKVPFDAIELPLRHVRIHLANVLKHHRDVHHLADQQVCVSGELLDPLAGTGVTGVHDRAIFQIEAEGQGCRLLRSATVLRYLEVCVFGHRYGNSVKLHRRTVNQLFDLDIGAPRLTGHAVGSDAGGVHCGEQAVDECLRPRGAVDLQRVSGVELHPQAQNCHEAAGMIEVIVADEYSIQIRQAKSRLLQLSRSAVTGIDQVQVVIDYERVGRLRAIDICLRPTGRAEHDEGTCRLFRRAGGAGDCQQDRYTEDRSQIRHFASMSICSVNWKMPLQSLPEGVPVTHHRRPL